MDWLLVAANRRSAGLNGNSLSSLDLIAASMRVDGSINLPAGNSAIYAVMGPNQVAYNTLAAASQVRAGGIPVLAIDVGASAGLYANQIYLLANEQGPGVNIGGRLESRNGGLTLDAAGNLALRGSLHASGAGSAVLVSAPSVDATGSINSAGLALVQSAGAQTWAGGSVKGSDVMLAAGGPLSASTTSIQASGDARLSSANELKLEAGSIKAGGLVSLSASGDLSLQPIKTWSTSYDGITSREFTRFTRTEIDAGGSVALQSTAGLVTLDGAQIKAGGSIAVQGLGVALLARKDLTKETTVSGATTTMPSTENLVQARLLAEGDIALLASGTGAEQGHIFLTGAKLEANNGHISLLAARNADITHDITTDRSYERFYEVKRSWFSKRVTDITKSSVDETANPSDISGRSVSIGAGGTINVVGSLLAADGAVGLHADQDLNLLATSEASLAFESRSVKKSGLFGSGGLSITIGSKSSVNITSSQDTRQASSSVISLAGDVMATAGGQYLQLSSDIVAPLGDVHIAAQNITLQSNNNTRSVLNVIRERQSGFTLAVSHPLVSAVQTAAEMAKVAKRTENGRFQALALLTSGLSIYNQYRPLNELSKSLTSASSDAAPAGWSVSLSLGASKTDFESLTSSTTPAESSINAGRNVSLTATGGGASSTADNGDINLVGSRITASENLTLKAQRDITLAAAVGKDSEQTKRVSSAAAVALSYGFGGQTQGLAITLAASRSDAWSNGWGTTFWNSELTAGKLLSVDSGRDLSMTGAKATGETVVARVGSLGAGNLSIVSPRDESFYQAKEQSYGFNVSIPVPGLGTGGGFSLSATQLKLLAENEAVKQQSTIVAGAGGYDISVNGHTHLVGAALASKAPVASNRLSTQTLLHEDVFNRDVVAGKSSSVGVSISASGSAISGGGSAIGFARIDSNESSHTRSSVAGTVAITRPDLQASRVQMMKSAERDPLAALRSQKQSELNDLRWNEPPPCDTCYINSIPVEPGAAAVTTASAKGVTATATATATAAITPPGGAEADAVAYYSNSRWRAWRAAMDALQREITTLDSRIAAIDAKVYQSPATLSTSASGLHTPLLHTFDKTKATQELRDGVAVTAAFGKAAYRAAGDFAGQKERDARSACSEPANCSEADKWKDGGIYRTALHAAIGGMAFGTAGATGNLAGGLALSAMDKVLADLKITDPTAVTLLKNLVVTVAGAATGGTAGAAAALNADANNRQLHVDQTENVKRRAKLLDGVEGKSAYQWEIELTQQLLRQNDRSYSSFSENTQARTVLADLQRATGISMSAEGTAAYDNAAINAEQLAANASSYLAVGNLPKLNAKYDLLTFAYVQAVSTPQFAALSHEKQREVLGQLMIFSESLSTNRQASAIQKQAADTAARTAAACVRQTGAMPADMPPIAAERRLGQGLTESVIGAAIVGANAKKHGDPVLGSAAERVYSSSRPMADVFPDLVGVNPHYVSDAGLGVNTNCVSCVNAADARLILVSDQVEFIYPRPSRNASHGSVVSSKLW